MNVSNLFKNLNDNQRKAVVSSRNNMLVLAGAGSGKTRVLVYRVAWLLLVEKCSPASIIAVTFTTKAVGEMRNRIEFLLKSKQNNMWIGTFHSIAHRLLRYHYIDTNLPQNFQIIDKEDQLQLIKRLIRTMNLNEKTWLPRQIMWYIDTKKEKGLRPHHIKFSENLIDNTYQKIYRTYQDMCDRAGIVDFSELLLRAYELWLHKPHILYHYQKRFSNILIDEFQDTNQIQYSWIRMLAGYDNSVMSVGDDDQSIYGWRGAQVANIHRFLHEFPNVRTIVLEQNYRSTSNILKIANTLIAHNGNRLAKSLWTASDIGEPIVLYCAFNELDEANFVVNCIKADQKKGLVLKDCAILYRSNAQSRVLEEALLQIGLPYHIYGSVRFFERQEIKDVLAYLRLIVNRHDDAAYERIVNRPTRGLGDRTLNLIRHIAQNRQITLWKASQVLLQEKMLSGRTASALQKFLNLLDMLESETIELPLHVQTDVVIKNSGLWKMYECIQGDNSQTRIDNLAELVTATRQFSVNNNKDKDLLSLFLSHTLLDEGVGQENIHQNAVKLMTLHSSKGLEFSQVFIVGMEEGMLPNMMSLDQSERIEEERRLVYVGITRAMKKLIITYAKNRRLYGKDINHQPSRFIDEMPTACIKEVQLCNYVTHLADNPCINVLTKEENFSNFKFGQRVLHPQFGEGRIINFKGSGKHSRFQIDFRHKGTKWLIATYPFLKKI
ncbi:DNA helicase II [Candidatus Curculioniphilus buchneri]|uniref:DNA helicase II n=1 Tax=Candidatus Curculioniphilus buchneri TaxID=690594 RepID=UPI00376F08C6